MFEIIQSMLSLGKVIVLGRGGVCLTRELDEGVRVRLIASPDVRLRRFMEMIDKPEREAREQLARQDKSRAKFLKRYFRRDIDDPLLYDAVWNTDDVPADAIARSVVDLVEVRAARLARV